MTNAPQDRNAKMYDRITVSVLASGALLIAVAYAAFGTEAAIGALAGALVALLNWGLIRFLGPRLLQGGGKGLAVLFGFKTVAIMTLCWILVVRAGVDFKGFIVGIGALAIGIVIGNLMTTTSNPTSTPTGGEPAATEET